MTDLLKLASFAGLKNTAPATSLAANDLVTADNVDLDDKGQATRRAGRTQVASGAAHSLWSAEGEAYCVHGGALCRLDTNYALTPLKPLLAPALRLSYLLVGRRLYWSNAFENGIVDGGQVRAWGLDGPLVQPPAQALAGGQLPAGSYQYALTYRAADGRESGTGIAGRLELPADSAVRFQLAPPEQSDITEQVLYLSTANGETLYRALIVPASATVADYRNDGLDLVTPLRCQWLMPPPPAQAMAIYRGRIYLGAGNYLLATAALGYEYHDPRDFLAIDGAPVRLLAAVDDGLWVGTGKGVYFLGGDQLDNLTKVQRLPVPAVAGSLVMMDGDRLLGGKLFPGQPVALFTTGAGVIAATNGGTFHNLTDERYRFPVGAQGGAAWRHDSALQQYIAILRDD